jgi:hypothetical protein
MYASDASTSTSAPPASTLGSPFHFSNLVTVVRVNSTDTCNGLAVNSETVSLVKETIDVTAARNEHDPINWLDYRN